MKRMGKVGVNRFASARPKEQRVSTLESEYSTRCERRRSPFGKLQKDDSLMYSKIGLSTQDTFNSEQQRQQTDELMKSIGLGCLVKEPKPTHKRTSTEISNLSQFENVDEDLNESKPLEFNVSHIKKSPLPKLVETTNEYGEILKIRK